MVPIFISLSMWLIAVSPVMASITINSNGGYKKIVVAIPPRLDHMELEPLIMRLKDTFRSASSALHTSTRGHFYFDEIIFAIPGSFNTSAVDNMALDIERKSFSKPDIHLTLNAKVGPFTLQHDGCGQPGIRIYLPVPFERNYFADKVIVHEWAHYRYGVYDEHGFVDDPVYPMTYQIPGSDDSHQVTGCTNEKAVYSFMNSSGFLCDPTSKDCLPHFEENENPNIVSSLMAEKRSPKITQFCNGQQLPHDREAPSMQNSLCREKSTWEVISAHSDFQNRNVGELLPTKFRYFLQSEPRVVLVIEATENLATNNRIESIRNAFSYFVLYDMPKRGKTWLVNLRKLDSPLAFADSLPSVESLLDVFPDAYGKANTCVSCGIREATKILSEDGQSDGYVVLVTTVDVGQEQLSELKDTLLTEDVKLFVVFFGDSSGNPPFLHQLAEESGGRFFYIVEDLQHHASISPITLLYESFRSIYESFSWTNKEKALIEQKIFYGKKEKNSLLFWIDETVETFQIVITGPDFLYGPPVVKDKLILKFQEVQYEAIFAYKRNIPAYILTVPKAQVGYWELSFQRKTENIKPIVVIVRATNKDFQEMVHLRTWITPNKDTLPWTLFAEIRRGDKPVAGSEVRAILLSHRTGKESSFRLLDSGEGNPDIRRNDGVYSRYLTGDLPIGYYTLSVIARNSVEHQGEASGTLKDLSIGKSAAPTGNFSRTATFGSVYLRGSISSMNYPPRRIVDMYVSEVRPQRFGVKHYVIKWTAPGNDLDSGQAHSYEMRLFSSRDDALDAFDTRYILTITEWRIHGPWLRPEMAGTAQSLIIQLSNLTTGTYYLAMRAIDADGTKADVSNVVSLYFTVPHYTTTISSHLTNPSIISTDASESGSSDHETSVSKSNTDNLAVIVSVTCGILLVMIVVAIFLLFYLSNRKKSKKTKKETISPPYFPRQRPETSESLFSGSQRNFSIVPSENPAYSSDYSYFNGRPNPVNNHSYYSLPTISRAVQDNISVLSVNDSILYSSLRRGHTPVVMVDNNFYEVPLHENSNAPFNPSYTSSLRKLPEKGIYPLGTDV